MSLPTAATAERTRFAFISLGALLAAVVGGWAIGKYRNTRAEATPPEAESALIASERRGEILFLQHCASCHGAEGRGDGASAAALRPSPRNFAARPWRFQVSKDSIRRVILDGLPGTPMGSFKHALAPSDQDALVDFTFGLATSRPTIAYEPSEEQEMLQAADFVDLGGRDVAPLAVTDAAGKEVTLAQFRGRLIVLHFWGMSCSHCLKELPNWRDLEVSYSNRGLIVLHVCTDCNDVTEAQKLLDRIAPGMHTYAEEKGVGLARFEVQSLPAIWIIGPDGSAIGRTQGARDWGNPAFRRVLDHWLPPERTN